MSRLKVKINKKDRFRPLITETTPYETPLIFSNDGFYENIKVADKGDCSFHKDIVLAFFEGDCSRASTQPYMYKINKSSESLRTLSLVHPISQKAYSDFYIQYDRLILHFCHDSRTSIRSPRKVGNTFFIKNKQDEFNKYRRDSVDFLADDILSKYVGSYFAYSGYDRLYKFIKSSEYLGLERKFPFLIAMDITNCFGSIYTHSISWATKSKEFAKKFRQNYMFGCSFDSLIQKSNYDETNGIPIGAEISRIFAEVILEDVDRSVVSCLQDRGIFLGKDYVIKRYVDDYFIFSIDSKVQDCVSGYLVEELSKYKLTINESKTIEYTRPFYSSRSALMVCLSDVLTDFFNSFLMVERGDEGVKFIPKPIRRLSSLTSNFLNRVKSLCTDYGFGYEAVAQYLISSIFERLKCLVESYETNRDEVKPRDYRLAVSALLDVSFFLYSVVPLVSSSYPLTKTVILSIRFFEANFQLESPSIKQRVYEHCVNFLKSSGARSPDYVENHIPLEKLNILVAMEELGVEYLVSKEFLDENFFNERELSYFDIISILFYIKNYEDYSVLKKKIYISLKSIFRDFSKLRVSSNAAHLFFDMISCPYLNSNYRQDLLRKFRNEFNLESLSRGEKEGEAELFVSRNWFVKWTGVDLYNILEKKELKSAY
ncbi:hypothetical protein BTJ40_14880 [Microbulbifer sp. A4B17]|uniref:antiviral reverse transcriptase Drt3b n=1 Tax=Microbulbifer sp. A4B17 TaxID=359370 RepID=UPI000D52E795|nr:antiviral reverse transcriptase Drt3b [Microbulbifer sp. A4B17]AWF82008.1 hypothetical protein BTJ40_14880 [Microbulbifer sp. A4B17]